MAKNLFNSVKLTKPKNNAFDLTHDVKLSMNMGELIPVMVTEAVPGDKFKISAESIVRFAPLVAPVMHRMDVSIHYFFVPNRILWDGWQDWIVNKDNNVGNTHPYLILNQSSYASNPLMDYMGLPELTASNQSEVNALPFAAYQCIYNEYYRDQNLIPEVNYKCADGFNSTTVLAKLRKRAWEHDYFTSCLPWAQKGAAVDVPFHGDVTLKPNYNNWEQQLVDAAGNLIPNSAVETDPQGKLMDSASNSAWIDPQGTMEVTSGNTTINDLRRAYRLQEWLEKNARAGTRYVENILAHFGVKSSDARLQRPEYITGVKSPVVISEVVNTTGETNGLPQGNMAGHGISVTTGNFGSYFCEEHGWIIGIMSVMPKTAYQQGIHRKFLKINDPFQYFWPTFAHIGEQEVFNAEIYANQANTGGTFGYVPRYAEYKFEANRVAGDFKTTLNFWHLGRIFATPPALNQAFVECDPTHRVFAVTDPTKEKLYVHVLNKVLAIRPMPKYGTPTF